MIVIGAGASAVATILFTEALFHGDFVTPVVIQKVQPLIAVAAAALVLGERPRRRFAWFLLPALDRLLARQPAAPARPDGQGTRRRLSKRPPPLRCGRSARCSAATSAATSSSSTCCRCASSSA